MEPTIKFETVVSADLNAYAHRPPRVGDIVVFYPPAIATSTAGVVDTSGCTVPTSPQAMCSSPGSSAYVTKLIKRIVAGPGDRLAMKAGRVILNGHLLAEPFIKPCPDNNSGPICDFPKTITVPADSYMVLGDNRPDSSDSRFWGPVRKSWILGKINGM